MSVEVSQRRLLVLYGSQTGCAQETSERIAREAIRRRFVTRVLPMDAYDVVMLLHPVLIHPHQPSLRCVPFRAPSFIKACCTHSLTHSFIHSLTHSLC
jgi:hypothetical protein